LISNFLHLLVLDAFRGIASLAEEAELKLHESTEATLITQECIWLFIVDVSAECALKSILSA
jgi:hypothetical protein